MSAHRATYVVHIGPIPDALVVRHTCDRIGCIEPTHLVIGTVADNNQDQVERDRRPVGESHPGATVSSDTVAKAVAEYLSSGRSQAEVARRYGVAQTTISQWVRAQARRDGGQRGVRIGKGRLTPGRSLKPCGTKAAYERHLTQGTPVCDACREAHREYMRNYKRKWRAAA